MKVEENAKTPIEFRITDSEHGNLAKLADEVETEIHEMNLATVVLPTVILNIEEPTTLYFQIREPKKRWQTLKILPVLQRPAE